MPVGNISSQYELDWDIAQSSQNIAGNTSSVYGRLIIRKKSGSGYWSNNACSWNVNINGTTYSGTFTYDFRNYGELTLWSGNVTVAHNADGTKTINSSGYANMNSPSGNATVGRTLGLTTIPRASTPSMGNPTTGSAVTINIARASSGFTHTVSYAFGNQSGTIATGVATSVSWTPPHSLFNQGAVKNTITGTGSITVDTFSGSTKIGSKNVGFTLTLNANQKPTMTNATFSEATTAPVNIASVIGAYVQGQTTLNYTVNGAAGILGSTISSYKIQVGSQSLTSDTATGKTPAILDSGTVAVKVSVIDSRGRESNVWTTNLTVLAWQPPKITSLDIQRAKADGTLDPAGTYLRIVLAGTVSSLLVGSTQKNTLTYKTDTSVANANSWTSKRNTSAGAVTSVSVTYVISPYIETGSFDIRTTITDRFATTTNLRSIAVAVVALMLGSNVAAVGKFWERGTLDVGGDIYANNKLVMVQNPGVVELFAGDVAPDGAFICDGRALSRVTYASLYAVIGTKYGAGNGSSTFNIPNATGRAIVGYDSAETEFNALGKSGGAKTHTLSAGELPAHNHGFGMGAHLFAWGTSGTVNIQNAVAAAGAATGNRLYTHQQTDGWDTTLNAGSGQAHNNLQPYLVMNYIIWT